MEGEFRKPLSPDQFMNKFRVSQVGNYFVTSHEGCAALAFNCEGGPRVTLTLPEEADDPRGLAKWVIAILKGSDVASMTHYEDAPLIKQRVIEQIDMLLDQYPQEKPLVLNLQTLCEEGGVQDIRDYLRSIREK